MTKAKDSGRRVNFLPVCELREFGSTFVDSDNERPSTVESMSYAKRWLDTVSAEHPVESDENILPKVKLPKVDQNASAIGLVGDSPTRKPRTLKPTWRTHMDHQGKTKVARVKRMSTTPKRKATVTKMRSESPRKRPSMGKTAVRSPFGRATAKSPKRLPSKSPRRRPRMGTLAVAFQQKKTAAREPSPSKAWNFQPDVNKLHQKRAGWPEDPIRRNTLHLKKLENIRKFERNDKMVKKAELQKNHGILWKKPCALELVRMEWRFTDEMESGGENPGDNELHPLTPTAPRKKKFLTVRERMTREIARKRATEEKKDAALRKTLCKKNLDNFIEKVKNGISLASSSSQDSKTSRFSQFEKQRIVFIRDNKQEPRVVDFHVRANIKRRLGKPIDRKVRIAYEVIRDNYDSVLGPHLFYLFTQKHEKHFDELERAFLIDQLYCN